MEIVIKGYPCGTIKVGTSVVSIPNSYHIKSISDMYTVLEICKEEVSKSPVPNTFAINKRTMAGMIIEWRAHNLLYALHIQRERTRTVDLDIHEKWYRKLGYIILSTLYLRW